MSTEPRPNLAQLEAEYRRACQQFYGRTVPSILLIAILVTLPVGYAFYRFMPLPGNTLPWYVASVVCAVLLAIPVIIFFAEIPRRPTYDEDVLMNNNLRQAGALLREQELEEQDSTKHRDSD